MNYVTLVNNTIQESGADLLGFETDGGDWNSYANTDMKSRFKTWVKRAWRTIQQEAFDWEWMSEQAVVNCTPGIMFYTKNNLLEFPTSDGTVNIRDATDDSIDQEDVSYSAVKELTGTYTNTNRFGYIDIGADSMPIDFSLKIGGEYFLFNEPVDPVSLVVWQGDFYGEAPAEPLYMVSWLGEFYIGTPQQALTLVVWPGEFYPEEEA